MNTQRTRAGERIGDTYTVDKLIARGGFSSVYRGTRLVDGREVAIKILELDSKVEATWVERFAREARLINQLKHPSTIRILDFGQGDRFLYLVMEYIKGRSLSRQIKKFGSLSAIDTAKVTQQILESLEEAHSLGILHRDLKPSNIMLGRDQDGEIYVKVLDFGVAKILDPSPDVDIALTQVGAFVGTPRYASPEQMRRETLSVSSDIYGVGMVMWECLVGDPAVPGVDYQSAVAGHLSSTPWRLPSSIECPPRLAAILHRSLEKSPNGRYQSAESMRSDVEAFIADELGFEPPTITGHFEGLESVSEFEEISDPIFDFEPDGGWYSPEAASEEVPLLQPARSQKPPPKPEVNKAQEIPVAVAQRVPDEPPKQDLAFNPRNQGPRPTIENNASSRGASKAAPVFIALLALVLVVMGAGIAFFVSYSTIEGPEPMAEIIEPDDHGSPAISRDLVLLAIRTGGWSVGATEESSFEDVRQTSFKASKDRRNVFVTIYECSNQKLVDDLLASVTFPDEAISYGKTVIKVSPTKEDLLPVNGMMELLKTFEDTLRKDGHL